MLDFIRFPESRENVPAPVSVDVLRCSARRAAPSIVGIVDAIESLIDKRIRQAMAEGAFDNLPGAGKPIPDLGEQLEPGWWAARIARRERSRARADETRDRLATALTALWPLRSETEVRAAVADMNAVVAVANRNLEPEDQIAGYDADGLVAKWRRLSEQRHRAR